MSETKRCFWHGEFSGSKKCPICKQHSQPIKVTVKGNIDEVKAFLGKKESG